MKNNDRNVIKPKNDEIRHCICSVYGMPWNDMVCYVQMEIQLRQHTTGIQRKFIYDDIN